MKSPATVGGCLALAYVTRSRVLGQLGRFEEAVADATAVIDLEPADIDALATGHSFRAAALVALGRTDEAAADAQTVLGLLPPTHQPSRLATALLAELGVSE